MATGIPAAVHPSIIILIPTFAINVYIFVPVSGPCMSLIFRADRAD